MDSTREILGDQIQHLESPFEPDYFVGVPTNSATSHQGNEAPGRSSVNPWDGSANDRKLKGLKVPLSFSEDSDFDVAALSLANPITYTPPHPLKIKPPSQFKRSVGRPRKGAQNPPSTQNPAPLHAHTHHHHHQSRQTNQRHYGRKEGAVAADNATPTTTTTGSTILSSESLTLRPPIFNPNIQMAAPNMRPYVHQPSNSTSADTNLTNRPLIHPRFAGAPNFTRFENGTPLVSPVDTSQQNTNKPLHASISLPQPSQAQPAYINTAIIPNMTRHPYNQPPAAHATINPAYSQQPMLASIASLCLQLKQAIPGVSIPQLMDQLNTGAPQLNLTVPADIDISGAEDRIRELLISYRQMQDQQRVQLMQQQMQQQPLQYQRQPLINPTIPTTTAASMNSLASNSTAPRPKPPTEDDMVRQDAEAQADYDEEYHEVETYADYQPSKVKIGKPHPDPVVETSSLATVEPPDITYKLKLPNKVMDQALLSSLQLESVIYACQQHAEKMPDKKTRRGFLIGDGAGVGKGRTIAGIIYENYLNGRKKSIWLSVSTDLKLDAERDLKDIGAKIPVFLLGKFPYGRRIDEDHGVIFTTYSGLVSKSQSVKGQYGSRMGQLIAWAGANFDGVIVFDECHKAKNISLAGKTASKKLSKAAENVLEIQEKLPNARIVYASATGASETRHLGYMTRLGIWGPGTPYPSFAYFAECIEKRGVGAMELVAVELKMRGSYIARQLSFKTTSFSILRAALTDEFISLYDACVDLWTIAFNHFSEAEAYLAGDKRISRTLWSSFWAAHQKFFKYLCISVKVPVVVQIAKQAIEEGKCVVVGLQSTGEAKTLEALEDGEVNEFISTAKATFESLIENHFPAPQKSRKRRRPSNSTDSSINFPLSVPSEPSNSNSSSSIDENRARDNCKFIIKDGVALPVILEELNSTVRTTRSAKKAKADNREGLATSSDRKQQALQELIETKKKERKSARTLRAKRRVALRSKSRIKKVATDSDTDLSNPTPTSSSTSSSEKLLSDDDFIVDSDEEDSDCETITETDEGSDDDIKVVGSKSAKKRQQKNIINDDSDDEVMITSVKPVVTVDSDGGQSDAEIGDQALALGEVDIMKRYGPRLSQMQDELLARVDDLGPRLPNNTLDDLIHRLGGPDKVAEMTGRKGRLIMDSDGQVSYRARNEVDASEVLNIEEKKRFMDGQKLIAIISEAASSGISLQADRRVKNQRRRVHITIELPWSADRAIQQFGRTHRSNQVSGPEYVFIISELSGETRFASIVAKRLESLGALTHGDRRATTEQRDLSEFNIAGRYCKQSLELINRLLEFNHLFADIRPNYQGHFIKDTREAYLGVGLGRHSIGQVWVPEPKTSLNINVFLNRILGMKVAIQNSLFDLFSRTMERLILRKKVSGQHDSGILELNGSSGKTRVDPPDQMIMRTSGGVVKCSLRNVRVERGISWEEALAIHEQDAGGDKRSGFYMSTTTSLRSKLVILAIREGLDTFRIFKPNTGRQPHLEYSGTLKDKFASVKTEKAEKPWRYIYETTDAHCVHLCYFGSCKRIEAKMDCDVGLRHRNYCILSGAIMTAWPYLERKVPEATSKLEIVRLRLDDNTREIGPKIPQACVEKVRRALKEAQVTGIEFSTKPGKEPTLIGGPMKQPPRSYK